MRIICSPWGITHVDYPKQGIMDMANAGFQNMMLDFGAWCNGHHLEYPEKEEKYRRNDVWRAILKNPTVLEKEMSSYIEHLKIQGLSTPIAYSATLLLKKHKMYLLESLRELVKMHIRLCGKYGCRYIIVPPISVKGISGDRWELNREYYMQFVPLAKEQNVKILLFNQGKDVDGHIVRGICSSPYEAVSWVDALNAEAGEILGKEDTEIFGLMLHVVNCNVCGMDMYEYIQTVGSRIKAVWLSDCDGQIGASFLPFTCALGGQHQTDWLGLIRGLRAIAFDGELILNFGDTAGGFSPLLRPQLMSLAKSVGEYFKWQIEIENLLKKHKKIVLFGAGNMCRNYMKCYGEKYPPLFTCDNNPAIWGTTFCGLEVKSPECLKELPEDCVIFICNVYYREIQQQLRQMGLKNSIEFFNDEYMPTFYFDRI